MDLTRSAADVATFAAWPDRRARSVRHRAIASSSFADVSRCGRPRTRPHSPRNTTKAAAHDGHKLTEPPAWTLSGPEWNQNAELPGEAWPQREQFVTIVPGPPWRAWRASSAGIRVNRPAPRR